MAQFRLVAAVIETEGKGGWMPAASYAVKFGERFSGLA